MLTTLSHCIEKVRNKIEYDAWIISNETQADEKVRMLYIGKDHMDKNFIRNLIFKGKTNEVFLGKVGLIKFIYYFLFPQKKWDFYVLKSRVKICELLKKRKDSIVPVWVTCEIDLDSIDSSYWKSKRTLKYNLRMMKRGDFGYVISKEEEDFEYFYYKMYEPYIYKKHKELVFHQKYDEMKKSFENGELLFIKEGNKKVAGGIIDYKKMDGIPRLTKLGVNDGDFEYVKRGALVALYYYTIQYLKSNNHSHLSLGLVRPFMNDGILRHKLSWGSKVVFEDSSAFLFSIISNKECLKKFFLKSPIITINGKKPALTIFFDQTAAESQYAFKNMEELKTMGLKEIFYSPL